MQPALEEYRLKKIGGIPQGKNVPFGGFGGMTSGELYRIPIFKCGELIFPDFPILAKSKRI